VLYVARLRLRKVINLIQSFSRKTAIFATSLDATGSASRALLHKGGRSSQSDRVPHISEP
jgi:hypothetical protein